MKLLYGYFIGFSLVIITFFAPEKSLSQFTYLEGGIGNTNLLLPNRQKDLYYHNMTIHLSGFLRFKRNIGVGGEFAIPVLHHSRIHGSGGLNQYFRRNSPPRYWPQEMEFTIQNSISGSIFARFFVDTKVNFYGELRFSVLQLKERFIFERDAVAESPETWLSSYHPAVDAVSIDETIEHLLFVPGLAIGIKPRIGKHLFLNFRIGLDLYLYNDDNKFTYSISNNYNQTNYNPSYEMIRNYGRGVQTPLTVNLGFGYFF